MKDISTVAPDLPPVRSTTAAQASPETRRILGIPIAWWVGIGCMFGLALGFSTVLATVFGQFIPALSSEFGWTRAETTLAMSFANIPLLIMAPAFGFIVDRIGAWRALFFSQLAVPIIVLSLATLDGDLRQLYFSFFLLTVLGAGTLPAAYTRVILSWFDRRRGIGFGMALSGVGLAALVLPPVIQVTIVELGWRTAMVLVSLFLLVAGMLNVMTLLRLTPRSHAEIDGGYRPEGSEDADDHSSIDKNSGTHWREAIRGSRYWIMALAHIPLGIASMGFMVNVPAILIDRSFSVGLAAAMTSTLGAALIFSRLIAGWFLDHAPTRLVMIVVFSMPAIGFFILATASSPLETALGIFLVAFGVGAEFDVMAFLLSRLFGPVSYGALYGGIYAAYNIGVAIGPVYIASRFDATGTYEEPLIAFGILFIFAATTLTWVARAIKPYGETK